MMAHDNEGKVRVISVCPVELPLAPRYTHEMTYRAMQQPAFVAWDISRSISITRPSSIGHLVLLPCLTGYTWFELDALPVYEYATGYKRKITISTSWLMSVISLFIYSLPVRLSILTNYTSFISIHLYHSHGDKQSTKGYLPAFVCSQILQSVPL
jgi:hypothetical protein